MVVKMAACRHVLVLLTMFLALLIYSTQGAKTPVYRPVGCFKDAQEAGRRPFPKLLANLRPLIDWKNMIKTVNQCARIAERKGYRFFGIQFYGECWSGTNSFDEVAKDGPSLECTEGLSRVGKAHANFVYEIMPQSAPYQCGLKQMSRIIGGETAVPHDWPWQAQIMTYNAEQKAWSHRCGATLIDPRWVVTAAHCVFQTIDPKAYKIRLGVHNQHEADEEVVEIPVSIIHMHTRFLTDHYGYDIAIMKLARPAIINHRILPACLPKLYEQVKPGTMCYVTGWGMTKFGGPTASVLQQARIPVVPYEVCSEVNGKLRTVDKFSMLCAGYGGNSSISGCHGDSGGPFVCQEKGGRWVLRGAVSWGDNECKGKSYSVFTRISAFVDWIKCKMAAKPLKKPKQCKDAHFYCKEWEQKGWCNYGYFAHMLKGYYCKKTCGACTP